MKKPMTATQTPFVPRHALCAGAVFFCLLVGSNYSSALAATYGDAGVYTDHGDGTVTDNSTGLMWQQTDDGAGRTWQQALDYCDDLVLPVNEGYDDWRLPNIKELESITDDSRYNPAIDQEAFPNTKSSYYWSSSTNAFNPKYAWYVYFDLGNVYYYDKNYAFYVRCVRGGQ